MAPSRSRKPMATIQNKESRQAEPGTRAMAGAGAADCEVSVFTAIVEKVYLFSHDFAEHSTNIASPFAGLKACFRPAGGEFHHTGNRALAGLGILLWLSHANSSLGGTV